MKFIERNLFIDKDKEESYLNYKSNIGESFYMKGFTHYLFEQTKPQRYNYRIKCVNEKSLKVLKTTYENAHTEIVSFKYPWLYLRKTSEYGTFNRYDDLELRIALYYKYLILAISLLLIQLAATLALSTINSWFSLLFVLSLLPMSYMIFIVKKIVFTKKAIQIKKGSDS